ncbi:cation diffusion facilitator family transporter [Caulobacter segnis]|uniref:cation diffusion facilitator family transporter n=1 Tax=Caulobacter segnis TaxID=88688 RepID=UPI00240F2E7F|nr:cation diffusion facilitator family transporter [Caulobacter segnis]MDG2521320.1 cation diffusion facilitator family transporter [Caulobacter segnis]
MTPTPLSLSEKAAVTRRITLLSTAAAALLILLKGAAFLSSGSVAILASLADSGLDLVASLVTLFAVRYAAAPPDAEHRFGHGKAEAFAGLMQAGLVFASGALIGREAVGRLLHPAPVSIDAWSILVMIASVIVTGGLIAVQSRALKKAGSIAVEGDRAHYAADLASNGVVIVGLGATALTGVVWIDAAAGLIVAAWLVWGAIGVLRGAADQLMDRELSDQDRDRVLKLMAADPRVRGVHQLRTRESGPYIHIQAHLDLDPGQTLEAAHAVVVAAERRVLEAFPAADILLHADPRGRAETHGGVFSDG